MPEINVPAGKPFTIKMTNANAAPAELEAREFKIEKVPLQAIQPIIVRVKARRPANIFSSMSTRKTSAKGYVIVE